MRMCERVFFCKVAGQHLATSLQINFFTNSFHGFYVNERLRMPTFRSCLKSVYETVFYCIWWLKFCNLYMKYRSSHQMCSLRKGVLRNFAKFTGKHLCQSPFLNKVAGLSPAALLKRSLWHRCFPMNLAKFLRTPFLQITSGRLLLEIAVSRRSSIKELF